MYLGRCSSDAVVRAYSLCMGATWFPRCCRSCCPATLTGTRCSTVLYTRPTAPPPSARSHAEHGGNGRCSLTVLCDHQSGKQTVGNPEDLRWPTNYCSWTATKTRDRIFITDFLPYLEVKGVVLFGVPNTSLSSSHYARPPGIFPGLWLVGAASSWKTWPLPNVWQVKDIVFTVRLGGVVYATVQCRHLNCTIGESTDVRFRV